jgi:adenylate cyclase, class 2
LRVRERGGETILTYKGPVERDRHKSREELETEAGEAAALLAILAKLGFAPTYRYEKFRTEFARAQDEQHSVATVDETPIGVFCELEGPGDWIDSMASTLGFSEKDYINDSYSQLFRTYCREAGVPVGDGMVFQGEGLSRDLGPVKHVGGKDT